VPGVAISPAAATATDPAAGPALDAP